MAELTNELGTLVKQRHARALRRGAFDGKYLSKKERIVLGHLSSVTEAINDFFISCQIKMEDDRNKLINLIFDLSESRYEEIEKISGVHDDHIQVIKDFNTAADVIKSIMDNDPDFATSRDVNLLHQWIKDCVPDVAALNSLKNYQPESQYSKLIYEIIVCVRENNSKLSSKQIYGNLDTLLFEIYPSGLRKSRSVDALISAFKAGQKKSNPI